MSGYQMGSMNQMPGKQMDIKRVNSVMSLLSFLFTISGTIICVENRRIRSSVISDARSPVFHNAPLINTVATREFWFFLYANSYFEIVRLVYIVDKFGLCRMPPPPLDRLLQKWGPIPIKAAYGVRLLLSRQEDAFTPLCKWISPALAK